MAHPIVCNPFGLKKPKQRLAMGSSILRMCVAVMTMRFPHCRKAADLFDTTSRANSDSIWPPE
ncbi:MAG: hypothetical protein M2R45_03138 [Verrucomicrobia subdivision 3 bacterium]|nr:hypothetical protein [Limisphaerales bacterium]MCS1413206.1 hypothetical protein [Limisphaerales bacterium]